MNDTKWIDSFTRALADITEPERRSLICMVLIGVINEYKNGSYETILEHLKSITNN